MNGVKGVLQLQKVLVCQVKMMLNITSNYNYVERLKANCNRRLVSSIGRTPDCNTGGGGFELQTGRTLRVLK